MIDEKFTSRTELLIGKQGIKKLQNSKVAIFGLGGVGSYVVEGLSRAGVGNFILVDNDKINPSNINRQIIATTKTVGKPKVIVEKERILEINPEANVEIIEEFLNENSPGYRKRRSRAATKSSYHKAIITYYALIINQANK